MEPLKEMFNAAYYDRLLKELTRLPISIDAKAFRHKALKDLEPLSLNERLRHTTKLLKDFMPSDFRMSQLIMKQLAERMPRGYTALVYPDYVAQYGMDEFDLSLELLAHYTSFGSSEFAVRHFLKADFSRTIKVMEKWSKDKNEHLRRLSSEGSRPRLPWSFKLDEVIENPSKTQKILFQLRKDESLYVRKSVANHLNDLSKDHPDYLLEELSRWEKDHKHIDWIIKQALRTLVKKGDRGALSLLQFESVPKIELSNLSVNSKIKLGDRLKISFDIRSKKKSSQKLVIDYVVHYVKKSGDHSAKVFKLKNVELAAGQSISIAATQVIKDFSTRKHFAGKHQLEIQINGQIMATAHFNLKLS